MANSASDLAEAQSKVDVVFGDASKEIAEFAATSARAFGVSKEAALSAAGTYGNLFTAMGLGQDEAAGMSVELVGLASDLASFNNIASEDALDKLRAGLIGEIEPLRSLGVSFNAAQVEAKALELGLENASGAVSEAAKIQARYALVLEQTTAAQGDFARTSDGAANQQRILGAQMADLKAEIGAAFLPVMLTVVKALNDDLVPALRAVGKFIKEDVEPAIRQFWEEYGPGIKRFWEEDVKPAFDDFLSISQEIVGFIRDHWPEIEAVVRPVLDEVINRISLVIEQIGNLLSFISNVFKGEWGAAWEDVKEAFFSQWDSIKETFSNFTEFLSGVLGAYKTAGSELGSAIGNGIIEGITSIWDSVIGWLKEKMRALLDVGIDIPGVGKVSLGTIGGVISGGFGAVGGAADAIGGALGIGGGPGLGQIALAEKNRQAGSTNIQNVTFEDGVVVTDIEGLFAQLQSEGARLATE